MKKQSTSKSRLDTFAALESIVLAAESLDQMTELEERIEHFYSLGLLTSTMLLDLDCLVLDRKQWLED